MPGSPRDDIINGCPDQLRRSTKASKKIALSIGSHIYVFPFCVYFLPSDSYNRKVTLTSFFDSYLLVTDAFVAFTVTVALCLFAG